MIAKKYIKFIYASALFMGIFLLRLCVAVSDGNMYPGNVAAKNALVYKHNETKSVCLHYLQNAPVDIRFAEMRHKRALAGNIYVHEPFISIVHFVYTSVDYLEFYMSDVSEKKYLRLSLRGPPAIC